jgi:transcriptional regulator GlxA family with amidase domain
MKPAGAPLRLGFVLLPRFGLLALGQAVEALQAANDWLGEPLYRPQTLALRSGPVSAACGTPVLPERVLPATPAPDAVFVVSGAPLPDPQRDGHGPLHALLRERGEAGAVLGGLGTGALVLAQAGVLAGFRATVPWAHAAHLAQQHPEVVFTSHLFEIDRTRLSCAGGAGSLDLFIAWLGQRHGPRLVQALAAHFGLERVRGAGERQPIPEAAQPQPGSARLAEALALMQANLGEPLPTEEIARLVGVSRRQLERLFRQRLDELPSRYYTELRLARARRLLQQTSQSILQVGLACGFSSGSHFSNAYRGRFGHTPREERSRLAAGWRHTPAAEPPEVGPGAAAPAHTACPTPDPDR